MYRFEEKLLGDGAKEIGVRHHDSGELVAVITHPCAGAKWFVHRMGRDPRREYRTKRAAIESFNEKEN